MPVPELYSTNESIFGSSYEEYVKRFWEHYLEIPLASNPLYVSSICEAALRPSEPVFYLPSNLGRTTNRACKTRAGKCIFIPIIGVVVLPHEVNPQTLERQRKVAHTDQDSVKEMELEIRTNKSSLHLTKEDLVRFRISTGSFDAELPSGGMYGAPEGETKCIADGHYVITKPIEAGTYQIKFSARVSCTGSDCVPNEKTFRTQNTIILRVT